LAESVKKSEAEWQRILTEDEYRVLREKGTEPAFTGQYWNETADGVYRCRGCGTPLFSSGTKFDAGCGWPSFYQPVESVNVRTQTDRSHFMERTEVLCAACDGHLGHVFPDGPRPTGLRYCINSASIDLDRADEKGNAGSGETGS
jgi:peptide-methionine (R)-S-oxide reductase